MQIIWSEEDQGYIALAPELPGCNAFGSTLHEALNELNTAIDCWIDACQQSGEPVPSVKTMGPHYNGFPDAFLTPTL